MATQDPTLFSKLQMRQRYPRKVLYNMAHPPRTLPNQRQLKAYCSPTFIFLGLSLLLFQLIWRVECASVVGSHNERHVNNENLPASRNHHRQPRHNFRFLEDHNEYAGDADILDDGTFRLSLAIDDESSGVSSPSLQSYEPRVVLRVSGESGMLRQIQNEVVANTRASRRKIKRPKQVLQYHRESTPNRAIKQEEEEDDQQEESESDEGNDNYPHHIPYIESYREKYVRPDPSQFEVTTPRTTSPSTKSPRQEWSDIIAQVTTPSSFNEINSSASEHRLADFHFRSHLPAYISNKYTTYSEEDLENVADLDDEHSKYFVKTRPRSVTSAARSNIYSNFYYEPPSFSTKSVPIPVKTNKQKVVFASSKPTLNPPNFDELDHHDHDSEPLQQDTPLITTTSSNFSEMHGQIKDTQFVYHVKEEKIATKQPIPKPSAISIPNNHNQNNYFENEGNLKNSASNNPYLLKSSAETLDVSTSQSILSKVTVNIPHHPQFVIIKSDPHYAKTAATYAAVGAATPRHHPDEITLTSIKLASHEEDNQQSNEHNRDHTDPIIPSTTTQTTTESSAQAHTSPTTTTPSSTTTDATSIPGIPGVDYPTLSEIPQTSFDCKNQRYKGFFADIDTKCQAWHYCDFTDSHSTFLCPNGTLFSQVLLTCDWWFNVNCKQARQLYVLNERLYRYIKPPKPSFPEDFIGEHVDKWLLQQYNNGYLPKVRKKSKAKLVNLPPPPPPLQTTTTEDPTQSPSPKTPTQKDD